MTSRAFDGARIARTNAVLVTIVSCQIFPHSQMHPQPCLVVQRGCTPFSVLRQAHRDLSNPRREWVR